MDHLGKKQEDAWLGNESGTKVLALGDLAKTLRAALRSPNTELLGRNFLSARCFVMLKGWFESKKQMVEGHPVSKRKETGPRTAATVMTPTQPFSSLSPCRREERRESKERVFPENNLGILKLP